MKTELTKEQLAIFEQLGTIVNCTNGKTFFHFPYWIEKKPDSLKVELLSFDKLPEELVNHLQEERNEKMLGYDIETDDLIDVLNRSGINGLSHADSIDNDVTLFVTPHFNEVSRAMVMNICHDFGAYWYSIDTEDGVEQVFCNTYVEQVKNLDLAVTEAGKLLTPDECFTPPLTDKKEIEESLEKRTSENGYPTKTLE